MGQADSLGLIKEILKCDSTNFFYIELFSYQSTNQMNKLIQAVSSKRFTYNSCGKLLYKQIHLGFERGSKKSLWNSNKILSQIVLI
jgi:hypothetical protein